jgi:capsid protein
MNELPAGYKFTQFDPKQPTQNHSEFKKSMLLDIASALDVNGFSLSGDMSAVNYSSARVGLGEERDVWRGLQCVVSDFCRDVYHRWLRSAMMTGKVQVTGREFEQLQNPNWRARGWRYVDPQKEIGANIDAINSNQATYKSILGEQGIDLEEFLQEKQPRWLCSSNTGSNTARRNLSRPQSPRVTGPAMTSRCGQRRPQLFKRGLSRNGDR